MVTNLVSSERFQRILEENRMEISRVVTDLATNYSRLSELLGFEKLKVEQTAMLNSGRKLTFKEKIVGYEFQHLVDILNAYIHSNAQDRRNRIEQLAESYQRKPEVEKEILRYFELEI